MIVALAGRRIDAPGTTPARFPLENVGAVAGRIRARLISRRATALVCAAACGADLLALQAAAELGLRRRVVLPFEPARFRDGSVTDRPGDWGRLFDEVVATAEASRDLVVLAGDRDSEAAYARVSGAILDQALSLAREAGPAGPAGETGLAECVLAFAVWNGQPRGPDDLTATFARGARERGIAVEEVSTLVGPSAGQVGAVSPGA